MKISYASLFLRPQKGLKKPFLIHEPSRPAEMVLGMWGWWTSVQQCIEIKLAKYKFFLIRDSAKDKSSIRHREFETPGSMLRKKSMPARNCRAHSQDTHHSDEVAPKGWKTRARVSWHLILIVTWFPFYRQLLYNVESDCVCFEAVLYIVVFSDWCAVSVLYSWRPWTIMWRWVQCHFPFTTHPWRLLGVPRRFVTSNSCLAPSQLSAGRRLSDSSLHSQRWGFFFSFLSHTSSFIWHV